jgi:hypothetical protein
MMYDIATNVANPATMSLARLGLVAVAVLIRRL